MTVIPLVNFDLPITDTLLLLTSFLGILLVFMKKPLLSKLGYILTFIYLLFFLSKLKKMDFPFLITFAIYTMLAISDIKKNILKN